MLLSKISFPKNVTLGQTGNFSPISSRIMQHLMIYSKGVSFQKASFLGKRAIWVQIDPKFCNIISDNSVSMALACWHTTDRQKEYNSFSKKNPLFRQIRNLDLHWPNLCNLFSHYLF